MNDIFNNLNDYFSFGFADVSGASYFDTLPDEVKQAVNEHIDEFHSMDELRRFAETMMRKG
ncbi:hypothetical protein H8711_01945 [Clostridiaceae bacterium NSJ-31]|uniref:Uncharacterized protein n=1 Tax=Ligaoa zhengdingensis TaxID=2763658 RepID=A0A926DVX2_9FIRM|nr:SRP1/TIP1 family protein [Ligaoa zhengdingensis]MBC8545701.1 hypothetical protein [Ligaoa zhengdingensis]